MCRAECPGSTSKGTEKMKRGEWEAALGESGPVNTRHCYFYCIGASTAFGGGESVCEYGQFSA